jgi:putative transposase
MPFIRIWVHLIWSTKNRYKTISPELKIALLEHIKENAKRKNIWIDSVNCTSDHIHLLVSLGSEQSISKVAMLLKGESSHWINKENLTKLKFEWQDEYIAISVSESNIGIIRHYINNQEEHHRKKTFAEEYDEFNDQYSKSRIVEG